LKNFEVARGVVQEPTMASSPVVLLPITAPDAGPSPLPFLERGFRPFFLLAASGAILLMGAWLAALLGFFVPPGLAPTLWHGHEMVFGFLVAVISGFLLTAAEHWTNRPTLRGTALLALAALWVAGRVAMLVPAPRLLVGAIDGLFLPLVAVALALPIARSNNRRNFFIVLIVALLAVANVVFHGAGPTGARRAVYAALALVVALTVAISGRVVPMFTRNATGDAAVQSWKWIDRAAFAATVASGILRVFFSVERLTAATSIVAGVLILVRSVPWFPGPVRSRPPANSLAEASRETAGPLQPGPVRSRPPANSLAGKSTRAQILATPLLAVLHGGCVWLGVGVAATGLTEFFHGNSSLALHATTVGALGTLTLGMMVRVALGHTGRALRARPASTIAFLVMSVAAAVRIVAPGISVSYARAGYIAAGALWCLTWALYLRDFGQILFAPRVEER
jgi:uncharacterized protein involved in response to NO